MSQPAVPSSEEISQGLKLLRSDDPKERQHGILILSAMRNDPRVQQVFQHLYTKDPDPKVREMAGRLVGPAPAAGVRPPSRPKSAPPVAPVRRRRAPGGLFLLKKNHARLVAAEARRIADHRKVGRGTFWMAIVLLLVVGLLWAVTLPDWTTWYRLDQDGTTTTAEIVERQAEGGDDYHLGYRFEAGGSPYTDSQRVTGDAFEDLADDETVTVTYLPDDPGTSRIEVDNPADARRDRLTIAAAGLSVVTLLLIILGIVQRRRPHWLHRGWRLLNGQLVACGGRIDQDGDYKVTFRYRFRSPTGRVITGQIREIRNDLRGKALPRAGTPVAVYYRSDRAYRML